MVRFLKRIKQCEINEKIKSKSELQIDINQKYIFTAEGKNQIIFFNLGVPLHFSSHKMLPSLRVGLFAIPAIAYIPTLRFGTADAVATIPYMLCLLSRKKKQERSFGNLPALIFLDNEHVHPVRSMDSPKFFLSNVEHNTLFLKVAK